MSFKILKVFALWTLALISLGCAGRAVQTESLVAESSQWARVHIIPDVQFIDQSEGYCGPATLTMAMRYQHKDVSVNQLALQVYTPGSKGSFPADMLTATRRNGMMAVPVNQLRNIVQEVTAGNPVIIFENLGLSWVPQWHYALVVGYDLSTEEIILHSGHTAFERMNMKVFERSWKLADYWGLVILPPNKLAASAGEWPHVNSAVGLESSHQQDAAEVAYKQIISRWPGNLVALIGLGNLSYKKGNKKEAVAWLQKAVQAHPNSESARHNLSVAQKSL